MKNYLFQMIDGYALEEIEKELQKKGLQDTYIIQDDATGETFVGGRSRKKIRSSKTLLIEEKASVNWEDQWALFAEDFKEGKAHINLSPFGVEKTLLLLPGAGFGDLSHPTTHLMLEMMTGRVEGQTIVDIGTGSGILTLAGVLLGANYGVGIDIDNEAIKHAKENAKLNSLTMLTKFSKKLPQKTLPTKSVFLMNMILPEQREFNPPFLNKYASTWIVSGILTGQKNEYLKLAKTWGWRLINEYSRLEWIGLVFSPCM
jgi:ribosomal protein L11 methyltransferase